MKRLATVALCLLVTMSTMAQTENPRGIYKMMDVIAIERQQKNGVDWRICERVADGIPMLNRIASKYK